jgi:NADP-reducing hydrogenase subunit HndB
MKSLEELKALKSRIQSNVALRKEDSEAIKIVVGMATCGIAAGARPVLMTLTEEIQRKKLEHIIVSQVGCVGLCEYEPIVEVFEPGKEKVTYAKIDAEKAKKIIDSHIIGGKIVSDYTIGAVSAK